MATITIHNLDGVRDAFMKMPKEVLGTGRNIVKKATNMAEAEAKRQAPVDTGAGSKSIMGKSIGTKGTVDVHASYMKHVVEGS